MYNCIRENEAPTKNRDMGKGNPTARYLRTTGIGRLGSFSQHIHQKGGLSNNIHSFSTRPHLAQKFSFFPFSPASSLIKDRKADNIDARGRKRTGKGGLGWNPFFLFLDSRGGFRRCVSSAASSAFEWQRRQKKGTNGVGGLAPGNFRVWEEAAVAREFHPGKEKGREIFTQKG